MGKKGFEIDQLLAALAFGSFTFVTACSVLKTTPYKESEWQMNRARTGNYYFLPKPQLTIVGSQTGSNYTISVASDSQPDQRQRFYVRYTPNAMSDDNLTVTVGTNGLITGINTTAQDRTGDIISELAISAANAAKGLVMVLVANQEPTNAPLPFEVSFNPTRSKEVDEARKIMNGAGVAFTSDSENTTSTNCPTPKDLSSGGIFYHPPKVYAFTLAIHAARYRKNFSVIIPDTSRISCYAFSRNPFSTRTTALTVNNGQPTATTITNNSSMKGVADMLTNVTSTVAGAIPTIINAKVLMQATNVANQDQLIKNQTQLAQDKLTNRVVNATADLDYKEQLLKQQQDTIKAQGDLLKAETDTMNAMRTNLAVRTNMPQGAGLLPQP